MKILQVMAGAPHGGAETAFDDISLALAEAGTDMQIVTRPHDHRVDLLKGAGLKVHCLPFSGAFDIQTSKKLRAIIKNYQPDIVQTWMSRATQKTPAWKPSCGAKPYAIVSRLGGYYKLKNYKKTDYFVANTPDIQRYVIEEGVASDRTVYISNYAMEEKADHPVSRASLDTPEDVPLLLALGRLHDAKALDVLLKAMPDIPGAWLWIAGEGPLRSELEQLSHDLGVSDRVRFLGWREDRAALFEASDICVFPSRYEAFGNVVVQAWAQKTPLVTSDAAGPKQYVSNGEDALMVPIDNVEALATAVNRVISDANLVKNLVYQGFKEYQKSFTKEHTVQAYLDFYQQIIARQELAA